MSESGANELSKQGLLQQLVDSQKKMEEFEEKQYLEQATEQIEKSAVSA